MPSTHAAELVQRYLDLGGQRKSVVDDNLISTRLWDDEPQAAADFWDREIEPLSGHARDEIKSLLPSVSGDTK